MAPGTAAVKDHYALLEVTTTADGAAIKASYWRLARLKHPDKNRDNPNATADFQALQEAYSVLKDDARRQEYDRKLAYKRTMAMPSMGAGMGMGMGGTAARNTAGYAAAAAMNRMAEELRKKQRQQRKQDKNEGGEGLNSHHQSGDNGNGGSSSRRPSMNPRGPPRYTGSGRMPWEMRDETPKYDRHDDNDSSSGDGHNPNFNPNVFVGVDPGSPDPANGTGVGTNSQFSGRSYPPSPPNKPKWPKQPTKKDHGLEDQIRQARKDIRAEDKTIRQLERSSKKTSRGIEAVWKVVHGIEDEIATVSRKKAQIEKQYSLSGPMIMAMDPVQAAKLSDRHRKAQAALDSLRTKLNQKHAELDGATGQSRSIATTIKDAQDRKAKKEESLADLCRRWRVHEFGAASAANEDEAGGWNGWSCWEPGDAEDDSDEEEDEDDDEDEDTQNTGDDHPHVGGYTTASAEAGAEHWWQDSKNPSGEQEAGGLGKGVGFDIVDGDAINVDHSTSSFSYNPSAKEYTPTSGFYVPTEEDGKAYYGVGGTTQYTRKLNLNHGRSASHDLEGIFFGSQAEAAMGGATTAAAAAAGYGTETFEYYEPSNEQHQYEYYEQYGVGQEQQNFGTYMEDDLDDGMYYAEPDGGVSLQGHYQGKAWVADKAGDDKDGDGDAEAGKNMARQTADANANATGRRADQPQTTTISSDVPSRAKKGLNPNANVYTRKNTTEPDEPSEPDEQEEPLMVFSPKTETADFKAFGGGDGSDDPEEEVGNDESVDRTDPFDQFNADLLGPLEAATLSLDQNQHMPLSTHQTIATAMPADAGPSTSKPWFNVQVATARPMRGMPASITRVAGLAGLSSSSSPSRAAHPHEEVVDLNANVSSSVLGSQAREQAWRNVQWQGW